MRIRDNSRGLTTVEDSYVAYSANAINQIASSMRITIDFTDHNNPTPVQVTEYYWPGAKWQKPTYQDGIPPLVVDTSGSYFRYWIAESYVQQVLQRSIQECKDWLSNQTDSQMFTNEFVTKFHFDIMKDVVTKDFHAKRAKGEFTYSPMSHEIFEGKAEYIPGVQQSPNDVRFTTSSTTPVPPGVFWNQRYKISPMIYVEKIVSEESPPAAGYSSSDVANIRHFLMTASASDRTQCVDVSVSKSKSAFTGADLDLLITLAEGPETIKTIINLLRRIRDIMKSIKSGTWRKYAPKLWKRLKRHKTDPAEYARSIDGLSNIWLEMRYAIRPIMYDVIGLLKVLEGSKPLSDYQSYHGFHSEITDLTDITIYDKETGLDTGMRITTSMSTEGRAGILGELVCDEPSLKSLGLTNVGSLIWDKITFSFVAGWILDVGQLLYDLNPTVVYQEKGNWVTTRTTCAFYVVKSYASGEYTSEIPLQGTHVFKERIIDPVSRYFTVNVNLNSYKIIDLVALTKDLWLKNAR